jgi:hypothetical protein
MGDVVDLVLVETNRADEVDLDLVPGGDPPDQITTGETSMLGDRQDRWNVVGGVGVVGGEKGVVEVELANRGPICPRRPLRGETPIGRQTEDRGSGVVGMGGSLGTGVCNRAAGQ